MKRIVLTRVLSVVTVAALSLGSALAGGEGWETNFEAATKAGVSSSKPVLMEFTGSDWCPPCKMMKAQVFDSDAFKSYAADHLVLLELDFPRGGSQPAELKAQNEALAKKYKVEGFPTVILLGTDGQELARHVGFMQGGGEKFVEWVQASVK